MARPTSVGGIRHAHDAELGIDLDVADAGAKTAFESLRVELHAGADRPAHLRGLAASSARVSGGNSPALGLAGCAALVFHFTASIDLRYSCGALAQCGDDLFRRLRDDHGDMNSTAVAGQVRAETVAVSPDRVAETRAVVDAEKARRRYYSDRGARATDVRMACGGATIAVSGDVDLRRGSTAGIEPEN